MGQTGSSNKKQRPSKSTNGNGTEADDGADGISFKNPDVVSTGSVGRGHARSGSRKAARGNKTARDPSPPPPAESNTGLSPMDEDDDSPGTPLMQPAGLAIPSNNSLSASSRSPTHHPSPIPSPSENGSTAVDNPLERELSSSILSNPSLGAGAPGLFPAASTAGDKLRAMDIDDMINRLLEVGYSGKVSKSVCLKNAEITTLCMAARDVFLAQPTLIELSPPVKIVGDVHGQYSDLIRLFEMCGFPPSSNYLFLGDYVDRGKQSLETILLLLCYKVKYPENFFLLRGNHECANVTRGIPRCHLLYQPRLSHHRISLVYGFYDECKRRCNIKIWKTFIDVFNCLPIAAVVASKIFCVHGGLSPSMNSLEDVKRIQRPTDVPDYGLLNDLLWSDPSDTALDWEDNERGVSYCFGKAIINQFLARYDMDLICRAHMVVEDGYEFWNDRTLVTVFSAPNYCGGMCHSFQRAISIILAVPR